MNWRTLTKITSLKVYTDMSLLYDQGLMTIDLEKRLSRLRNGERIIGREKEEIVVS